MSNVFFPVSVCVCACNLMARRSHTQSIPPTFLLLTLNFLSPSLYACASVHAVVCWSNKVKQYFNLHSIKTHKESSKKRFYPSRVSLKGQIECECVRMKVFMCVYISKNYLAPIIKYSKYKWIPYAHNNRTTDQRHDQPANNNHTYIYIHLAHTHKIRRLHHVHKNKETTATTKKSQLN